jgi:hypothetical protein
MTTITTDQAAPIVPSTDAPRGEEVKVDVEKLRTMQVHVAIPCYGGQMTESTCLSLLRWATFAHKLGLNWTIETLVNESLISRGRNTMVAKFMVDQPKGTHLLFIDADIGFPEWAIPALLNHDVDVVTALYPMKAMPLKIVANSVKDAEEGPNGLREVSKAGTGFMLIKRDVFNKMKRHPAVKRYNNDIGMDKKYDAEMYTYFDTAVRQNRYYSEDWTFCENWRDLDGKIWSDQRIALRHTGTFVFCQEMQEHLVKEYMPHVAHRLEAWNIRVVDAAGNVVRDFKNL